jgi:hypothetical protein
MTATKFLKTGFYSQETAFQLPKKTLEGDAKKVVELISVEDEYACEDLMQSLEVLPGSRTEKRADGNEDYQLRR